MSNAQHLMLEIATARVVTSVVITNSTEVDSEDRSFEDYNMAILQARHELKQQWLNSLRNKNNRRS